MQGRRNMSITFSDVATVALLRALSQPGLRGQRIVQTGLFGLPVETPYESLSARFDTDLDIATEAGPKRVSAIATADDHAVVVYLVDESGSSGTNRGSAGFAATLRTQFLVGADPLSRTLLILDASPVETVRSATGQAEHLEPLQWDALVETALRLAQETSGTESAFLAEAATAFIRQTEQPGEQTSARMDAFCRWASRHAGGSDEAAGRDLHELGCFISDPQAVTEGASSAALQRRLQKGAWWRRELDTRYASKSKEWAIEARKLLQRNRVPPTVVEAVIGAAGAFGIEYAKFTFRDLDQHYAPPIPLTLHAHSPVTGARAAVAVNGSLAIWNEPAERVIRLRLARPAEAGDRGAATWADGTRTLLTLQDDSDLAYLPLPSTGEWAIGELTLMSAGNGGEPEPSQVARMAVCRRAGGWFPVEDSLVIEPSQGAFVAQGAPDIVVYAEGAVALGQAVYELPASEEDIEMVLLDVTFAGEAAVVPVLLAGSVPPDDGGPEGPTIPPDDGGPEEDEPDGPYGPEPEAEPRSWASIPHALLDAWPSRLAGSIDPRAAGWRAAAHILPRSAAARSRSATPSRR